MIGLTNDDSSFFEIDSDDVALDNNVMAKNLIKLSVTEQRDAMTQGTLSFYDKNDLFSRILRTGVNLKISWGYRDNLLKADILNNKFNPSEINGSLIRRGLKGFISSPSGSGSSKGQITYNCNFTCYKFRGLDESIVYSSGTRRDVITEVFNRIGISPIKRFINFRNATDRLNTTRSVRQDETDFQFLTRLAREWSALFSVGFSPTGETVALFMDNDKIGNSLMPKWVSNATGSTHAIGYKGEISNVISYNWKSNESENGVGSNVQLDFVDGRVVLKRFVAEQEKVITYRLRPERIKEAIADVEGDGIAAQTQVVKDLLRTNDFEDIKHFFDPYESTTAPQGFGYRIAAQQIGNPLVMPPNQVIINNGFPDRLGGKQAKYYYNKVTHNIEKTGYKMSTEIVDVFSISDIGTGLL